MPNYYLGNTEKYSAKNCVNGDTTEKLGIWDKRQFHIRSGKEQGAFH